MSRITKYIAFLFLQISFSSFSQTLDWVKTIGSGQYTINPKTILTNQIGEVIISGSFFGSIDVDPSEAVVEIASNQSIQNSFNDFFVLKLSAEGELLWIRTFGGKFDDRITSMGIDSQDNIYITGIFGDTIDADPDELTTFLIGENNLSRCFILKLNDLGDLVWAKSYGGEGFVAPTDLLIDHQGNCISFGEYSDTVDFDPNIGISFEFGVPNEPYLRKMYVQKIDPGGNFLWSKSIGGITINSPISITGNLNNEITLSGIFADSIDLNPSEGTAVFYDSVDFVSIFQSTIDENGNFIDGGVFTSEVQKPLWLIESISDQEGNRYLLGYFEGTIDFDLSNEIQLLNAEQPNIFLIKQSSNGGFIWGKTFDLQMINDYYHLQVDNYGSVYIAGNFRDTVDFDSGSNEWIEISIPPTPSGGPDDVFILKLTSEGDFDRVNTISGNGNDGLNNFFVGQEGEIYLTGYVQDTIDCDPTIEVSTLIPYGATIYIVKWRQDFNQEFPAETIVFPNPSTSFVNIQLDANYEQVKFSLIDSKGAALEKSDCSNCNSKQLDLSEYSSGIYFLQIQYNDKLQIVKILKN